MTKGHPILKCCLLPSPGNCCINYMNLLIKRLWGEWEGPWCWAVLNWPNWKFVILQRPWTCFWWNREGGPIRKKPPSPSPLSTTSGVSPVPAPQPLHLTRLPVKGSDFKPGWPVMCLLRAQPLVRFKAPERQLFYPPSEWKHACMIHRTNTRLRKV